MKPKRDIEIIVTHKEAFRDYFILETLEAGIVLVGCEVKSLRSHEASLSGSFARVDGARLVLHNAYIAPYKMGNRENPDPRQERLLLVHRSQFEKLKSKVTQKGQTLVPLKMYFSERGMVKVEIALVKGKNLYDKRQDIRKAEADRHMDREMKNKNR